MAHKYKNRGLLRYLTTNLFKENPATTVLNFVKDHNLFLINKNEDVNPEFSNLFILFKKGPDKGVIYFNVSKDHLIRSKITFREHSVKLTTRSIDEFIKLARETILGN